MSYAENNERKCAIALYECEGGMITSVIADECDLPRNTTRDVLARLERRGIVKRIPIVTREQRRRYCAYAPWYWIHIRHVDKHKVVEPPIDYWDDGDGVRPEIAAAAEACHVTVSDILSRNRKRPVSMARHIAATLMRDKEMRFRAIAGILGVHWSSARRGILISIPNLVDRNHMGASDKLESARRVLSVGAADDPG